MPDVTVLGVSVAPDSPSSEIYGSAKMSPDNAVRFRDAVKDLIQEFDESGPGAAGKPVIVKDRDPVEAARWEPGGPCPRNGLYANPVEVMDQFPSARALSTHLGLKHNEVCMALNKVADRPVRDRIATLRGISFMFFSDFHEGYTR